MSVQYLEVYRELKTAGRETRTVRRVYLENSKEGKSCADCETEFPPYILQYDHVRGIKKGNLRDIARNGTMEELLEEIEKCEIVCANCHAHRTYTRQKNKPLDKKEAV